MIVLEHSPGMRVTCKGCTSVYMVQQQDVREMRPFDGMGFFHRLFRFLDATYQGPLAVWNCSVCGRKEGKPFHEVPSTWLVIREDSK